MTKEEYDNMLTLANKLANSGNTKTNDAVLDSTLVIPRNTINAGLWLGFVKGFMYAYKLNKEKK